MWAGVDKLKIPDLASPGSLTRRSRNPNQLLESSRGGGGRCGLIFIRRQLPVAVLVEFEKGLWGVGDFIRGKDTVTIGIQRREDGRDWRMTMTISLVARTAFIIARRRRLIPGRLAVRSAPWRSGRTAQRLLP